MTRPGFAPFGSSAGRPDEAVQAVRHRSRPFAALRCGVRQSHSPANPHAPRKSARSRMGCDPAREAGGGAASERFAVHVRGRSKSCGRAAFPLRDTGKLCPGRLKWLRCTRPCSVDTRGGDDSRGRRPARAWLNPMRRAPVFQDAAAGGAGARLGIDVLMPGTSSRASAPLRTCCWLASCYAGPGRSDVRKPSRSSVASSITTLRMLADVPWYAL